MGLPANCTFESNLDADLTVERGSIHVCLFQGVRHPYILVPVPPRWLLSEISHARTRLRRFLSATDRIGGERAQPLEARQQPHLD